MDSQSNKRRMNVQDDRLSSLSDDLIAKIIAYNGVKQAVETSVLSSRWKSIWTLLPYLNFSSEDFSNNNPKFYKFLTRVFSFWEKQMEFSIDLNGKVNQVCVDKILRSAFSRNIQKLTFTVLDAHTNFNLPFFSCESLKHLTLAGSAKHDFIPLTSMWNLPSLTTLHLDHVTLYNGNTDKCAGLFFKCPNLKDLTLDSCCVIELDNFTISHSQLSNLTLKNRNRWHSNVVNVSTPQLKNLAIINAEGEHKISAPKLTSLLYKNQELHLSLDVDSFQALEKVDLLCTYGQGAYGAHKVVHLLRKLNNVKVLTLSLEIIELLSSEIKLIAHQPSPLVNLKSLRICPELLDKYMIKGEGTIPTKVKNYLLGSSPSATLTMVSRKELRDVRDANAAQDLMGELKVLLDKSKAEMQSHKAVMKPQPMKKMSLYLPDRVMQIESYWVDLTEQIHEGQRKTSPIIKLIQRIKVLLKNLPTSKKVGMQSDYSSLCAEADTVIKTIIKRMKVGHDKKEMSLINCFDELITTAKSAF